MKRVYHIVTKASRAISQFVHILGRNRPLISTYSIPLFCASCTDGGIRVFRRNTFANIVRTSWNWHIQHIQSVFIFAFILYHPSLIFQFFLPLRQAISCILQRFRTFIRIPHRKMHGEFIHARYAQLAQRNTIYYSALSQTIPSNFVDRSPLCPKFSAFP